MTELSQILSWVVTIVGLVGFYFAGQKKWWCWYINLFCQILWTIYAIASNQPAFLVSVAVYSFIFGRNAYRWTKEHHLEKSKKHTPVHILTEEEIFEIGEQVKDGKLTINQGRERLGFPKVPQISFNLTTDQIRKQINEELIRMRIENEINFGPSGQTVFRKAPNNGERTDREMERSEASSDDN